MSERPLHFRALDRLAMLGNRSYQNPLLAKSYELFFAPFGLSPNYVEISIIRCAAGEFPPLYLHSPRFRPMLVRQLSSHAQLFEPILDAGSSAEVLVTSEARVKIRVKAHPGERDITVEALATALEGGLEREINAALAQAEEYFRGYLAAAVRVLGDPDTPGEEQEMFLRSPDQFAIQLASQLSTAVSTDGQSSDSPAASSASQVT